MFRSVQQSAIRAFVRRRLSVAGFSDALCDLPHRSRKFFNHNLDPARDTSQPTRIYVRPGRVKRVDGPGPIAASTPLYRVTVLLPRRFSDQGLPAFEFGDEEDLAAFADRLEIGGLVDRAVDCDGGF